MTGSLPRSTSRSIRTRKRSADRDRAAERLLGGLARPALLQRDGGADAVPAARRQAGGREGGGERRALVDALARVERERDLLDLVGDLALAARSGGRELALLL